MRMPLVRPPSFPSLPDAILFYYPLESAPPSLPPSSYESAALFSDPSPLSPPYAISHPSRFVPNHTPIFSPQPRQALPRTSVIAAPLHPQLATPGRRDIMDRPMSMSRSHSQTFRDAPDRLDTSPRSIRSNKSGASPHRHHHQLNALSPLQAFSPLQTPQLNHDKRLGHSRATSEAGSAGYGGHSRSNSVTKSLSRRQSLIASAERWKEGNEWQDENIGPAAGLFSKLTLVKAPNEGSGLKK